MSDIGWPLVRELFEAVVELPEAERAAHLARASVSPGVRTEVERMLRSDGAASGFLESSFPLLERALLPQIGTRLGHYELKRVIASGGMGTVFEAVQDEPRRTVALKTLRFGLSSPERLQRFRFEAEVLGHLRHPAIAQIFEAGTHEQAGEVVPFIAMELVPGARDLMSYAREEELELPQRLALFLEVCEAVQHGHQKGVIHRDLKPGNILVDAEGRAKVIDFGVARATARASGFGDVTTQTGQILGTFAYMAPELLAGSPESVDVRGDVYALGIVLFELIEGRPPHELASKSPAEVLRTIQEEPPRPSAGTPRELRWILVKALAKEPERRYGSVAELAADLGRYLRGEPVLAGAPSIAYRLSKWLQRNPAKTAAAAIGVTAFVAITWLLLQNVRVNRFLRAERTNLANANIALQVKSAEAEASAAQALENARVAKANERQALDEKERADREAEVATKKADEVLRLSALQDLDDLVAEADRLWPITPQMAPRYEVWLDRAQRLALALPSYEAKLQELRRRGRAETGDPSAGWVFESGADRWWHNQLAKLVEGLKDLSDEATGLFSSGLSSEYGRGIEWRLDFARTVEGRSVSGPDARARWDAALASIRDASECPWYARVELSPQVGLLPIGQDPESGLWEFAHLQTGEPAERGPDGKLRLKEETGLVFVLLPGGTFWMGAQRSDPKMANYDPQAANNDGPPWAVTLSPFFLSKYEMTQGQWLRVTGRNPSQYGLKNYSLDASATARTQLHPVEQVSWSACDEACHRLGLSLPSEAQWEYAARGGTETRWWPGDDPSALAETDNLADEYARRTHGSNSTGWSYEAWNDGRELHAPIGQYVANPFGLHDVHGNVCEWCADAFGTYAPKDDVKDPLFDPGDSLTRVVRGGGFSTTAVEARSGMRNVAAADNALNILGLRPARAVVAH